MQPRMENRRQRPRQEQEPPSWMKGRVKFWRDDKGYGMVETPRGDALLHVSILKRIGVLGVRGGDQLAVRCKQMPDGRLRVAAIR